ncbi:unnamed protein product, partial [Lymnaea stagnalis]
GAVGNLINVRTFVAMGICDGVNVGFTWLAASDLAYVVFSLVDSFAMIFRATEGLSAYSVWFPVEPGAVHLYAINVGNGLYSLSVMTTDLVTIIRCLSVVRPLQFRKIPSWRKMVMTLSAMTTSSLVSVIALFIYMDIVPKFDVNVKAIRLVLWMSPKRFEVRSYIFGVRDAFLPFSSQIILVVCSIIMADALRKASKFRQNHSTSPNVRTASATSLGEAGWTKRKPEHGPGSTSTLGGQELQVVRQMLLISSVALLCNLPKVSLGICGIVIPDFTTSLVYYNVYNVLLGIRELFQTLNASLHFLIYWSSNSKFRKHCMTSEVIQ